jgi:multidrug efflux pump subunit AcrA (membrane-fusion protein)
MSKGKFMNETVIGLLVVSGLAAMVGCDRKPEAHAEGESHGSSAAPVTNRVAIPSSVRMNLGITFAKVETRNVSKTLRVPGRFELLPTARREYRTALAGRVELLVQQYERVEAGTPLYRVDSTAWRDLHEQIASTQAKVDSMTPLREAHRRHEKSLEDKVALWQERIKQLDELRAAGGGSASQFTEARATLNATQAELADVMEKDAELGAQEKQSQAELRSLMSRREVLIRAGNCGYKQDLPGGEGFVVCAVASGVVEMMGITPGGLADENGHVLTVVQPEQIRFRARGMQADLGRLKDGLKARIAPPQGGSVPLQDAMTGVLQIGLTADADERTVDLVVRPEALSAWARAGVSAHLEITLEGGAEELAIPLSAVVRDGATPIIFRRDPANADQVIRMEADVGISDGRWTVIGSGVTEGDEVVVGGNYQLMLATSGNAAKGGHFHPDGTFHEGEDK